LASPFFWEISKKLLEFAQDDILGTEPTYSPNELKSALDDLWTQRMNKIHTGLVRMLKSEAIYSVELENVTVSELNAMRPLFQDTLAILHTLHTATQNAGPARQFIPTPSSSSSNRQRVGSKSRRKQ